MSGQKYSYAFMLTPSVERLVTWAAAVRHTRTRDEVPDGTIDR